MSLRAPANPTAPVAIAVYTKRIYKIRKIKSQLIDVYRRQILVIWCG